MAARFSLPTICVAIAALVVPSIAEASPLSIHAGDPRLPGVVSATWRNPRGEEIFRFDMPVDGTMTASDMAAVTADHLRSSPLFDPDSISLVGETVHKSHSFFDVTINGGSLEWESGTTAQDSITLYSPYMSLGAVAAVGHFDPFYQPGQPAIFTAGIVTDVGELTATVSAQELNFQTDGPIICQALFQRLAPRAPQYGVQISYYGDRLSMYFDPAYMLTQRGIIFGTTSPSQGFSGTVGFPAMIGNPVEPLYGDSNDDQVVDAADYVMLRKGIFSPYTQDQHNMWRSHFGEGSGTHNVPEPAMLGLVILAAAGVLLRGRNRCIATARNSFQQAKRYFPEATFTRRKPETSRENLGSNSPRKHPEN